MFAAHGSDVVQLASFIGVKFKLTGILKLINKPVKRSLHHGMQKYFLKNS
jgi:hypothetical protein